MELRIDDPKANDQKQNLSILLSESAGDCTPKDRQLFAVTHWIPMESRIDGPKMKDQRQIISVFLSESAGDCVPKGRWLFAVSH